MAANKKYDGDEMRRRSLKSPWRKMSMAETNRAFKLHKMVVANPGSKPRPDLDKE